MNPILTEQEVETLEAASKIMFKLANTVKADCYNQLGKLTLDVRRGLPLHSVQATFDGCTRYMLCNTYYDGVVVYDALQRSGKFSAVSQLVDDKVDALFF